MLLFLDHQVGALAANMTLFETFSAEVSNLHALATDNLWVALVTSARDPLATDDTANPFALYTEVAVGGGYAAGGLALTGTSFSTVDALATLVADPAVWTLNAASPTNARWAIIYNASLVADNSIAFFDLGQDTDLSLSTLTLPWRSGKILTIDQP